MAEGIAERSAEIMRKRETEEIAWVVAGEAVTQRITSAVPQEVQRFLFDHWQYVLKELYIRHGEEHHAYLSAVSMVDDLIWSVAPKTSSVTEKASISADPAMMKIARRTRAPKMPQKRVRNWYFAGTAK